MRITKSGCKLSINIAIAGAGIGGLCCALAMAKSGFTVTVFEQSSVIQEVGAGLQLSPNAVTVLNALQLSPLLTPYVFCPQKAVMRHYQHATEYFSVPLAGRCEQRFGAPYWHIHRADLQASLYQACIACGVDVRLAKQVVAYEQNAAQSTVNCMLADGSHWQCDVLIGADGIHSKVQASMLQQTGLTSHPRFTGQVAWRGTVPVNKLAPGLVEPNATLWVGPGKHFVNYYLRAGKEVNFVAVEERSDWQHESWRQAGDISTLRGLFGDWHPQVQELLAAADSCFVWALHDRAPLSNWVHGNVALLGDACHPMLPFLAQGAAMAIEDGYVLAQMLSQHKNKAQALKLYQNARLQRTSQVQSDARRNAAFYHMSSPIQRAKLKMLSAMSGSGINNWLAAKKLDTLYGYNAVERTKVI